MLQSFRALLKRKTRRRSRSNGPISQALQDSSSPPPSYDASLSPLLAGGSGFTPPPRHDLSYDAFAAVVASGAIGTVCAQSARRAAAAADTARAEDAPAVAAAIAGAAAETALAVANCFVALYPNNEVLAATVNETARAFISITVVVSATTCAAAASAAA
ncbi:hypothetical protein DL764_001335 [Monosporascus ibericus]|uniref:Uncharacterized protein n=1 Tax=Monosporascus ibericus TaxID=155417 RepID=A0A4Q4TRF1_9PEZI|nr:hypothetical protein DL764_001335 [Monosporascus ibericus]